MVATVVVWVLFIIPFLLLTLFKDKKRGFIYVVFFLLVFHTAVAFFTQLFSIFYYPVILIVTILAYLAVLGFWFYKKKPWQYSFKNISFAGMVFKIDWMLLAVALISVLSLYQVHHNYTGKISLVGDLPGQYHEVKSMKYDYPYFSDEWYAVSFIDYSIQSHHLPFTNPLENSFFLNVGVFTYSFLAEIMLLLGLKPLLYYTVVSIAVNTLVIILAYLFLRLNMISKLSSAVASLSLLYITSGVNLPGIWNLLPVTFGVLFCLMLFCFISLNDVKMASVSFIMISLFYGLLIPFYGAAFLLFLLSKLPRDEKTVFKTIGYAAACLFLMVLAGLTLAVFPLQLKFAGHVAKKLLYTPLLEGFIPQFNIFYIIPIPIIFLAVAALPFIFKRKKWLFATLAIGCAYWVLYFLVSYRIIIEFERVVFFTSIVIALVAGFGLDMVFNYISSKFKNARMIIFNYGGIFAVLFFLLLMPFYTSHDTWLKLVAVNSATGAVGVPRAPANNYFTPDDARIFNDIKGKKFLSVPWKGTVMGVATGNYPLVVKAGVVYFGIDEDLDVFLQADCKGKKTLAQRKNLDYVYLPDFNCEDFKKIDKSQEGFVLYEFIK